MSGEMVELVVPLRRTDPAQVALQVRQELHLGGVAGLVVDITEAILLVERTAERQTQIEQESNQQQILGDILDPMDVVMRESLRELRVSGMSLKEAMFEAAQLASESGGAVAFWSCGNIQDLTLLGDFKVPLLKSSPLVLLGAPVMQSSEHLGASQLVGCVAPMQGALPVEVEHGLLIRMEDLRDDQAPQHTRRDPPPRRPDPPASGSEDGGRGSAGSGGGRPPVWFGG